MHVSRRVILAGLFFAAISLFTPLLSADLLGGVTGLEGAGWPAVALLALPAAMALGGDRAEGFTRPVALAAIAVSAVAVVFCVSKVVDAVEAAATARALSGDGGVGVGLWLLAGGAVAVLTGSVASLSRRLG